MDLSKINNQINRFSTGFSQATKDFNKLTAGQKILTVALSSLMGLATIFLGGIGGFATFKALVDKFTAKVLPKGADPAADKIDRLRGKIKDGPTVVITPEAYVKELSFDQLLEKTKGLPLHDNQLKMILLKSSNEKKSPDQEMQNVIREEIWLRVNDMSPGDQQKALEKAKSYPEKFALLAHQIANSHKYTAARNCEFLENCEWPSEELKENLLPALIEYDILKHGGIDWKNFDWGFVRTGIGFSCNRIYINSKNIFGTGDLTRDSKPISPLLAKAIGLAIRRAARISMDKLKDDVNKGEKNLKIGVEIEIAQSEELRFPASMIAPLLPHLKNIPGLVSLTLSDVGVTNPFNPRSVTNYPNGFTDEHAEDLLNIFRTSPYLQIAQINIDGMSEAKQNEFMSEWVKIWNTPRKTPSSEELLALKDKQEQKVEEEPEIEELKAQEEPAVQEESKVPEGSRFEELPDVPEEPK